MSDTRIVTQERIIDGVKYFITPFLTRKGMVLQAKLSKIILPSLFGSLNNNSSNNILDNLDLGLLTTKLFENLDTNDFEVLILELLSTTVSQNDMSKPLSDPIAFDKEFQTDYKRLYTLIYAVVEINFKSFLLEVIGSLTNKNLLIQTKQKNDLSESENSTKK